MSVRCTLQVSAAAALALAATAPRAALAQDPDLSARGKYLLTAGDCVACHTTDGGKPLAGGRYVPTPFGPIASPNITPDRETGIGDWSDDDFYRALHQGIRKDGAYLYPVFPFTSYTKVTRDDVLAIKAYLFTIAPEHAPQKPNKLGFPYNIRTSLAVWRQMFFHEGVFQPDPAKTEQVNRGAYLVEGLGHCAECHTQRNALGGSDTSKPLAGGEVQGWYAPNISGDMREGLGNWSENEVVAYLKTGSTPTKGVVVGPMAEVVHGSLSKLSDDDLHDIALYLRSAPGKENDTAARNSAVAAGAAPVSETYMTYCASCHQQNGSGVPNAVPPLAGNGAVAAAGPQNVIQAVLGGFPASGAYTRMPGFSAALTNDQIVAVTNYVRNSWGNGAPANATLTQVADLRKMTRSSMSGIDPECPAGESNATTTAIADPATGIGALLHDINDGNVLDQVNAMVAKLRQAVPQAPSADIVNGLTDAYCPIVASANGAPIERKRWELNQVSQLVYVAVTSEQHAAR